MRSHEAFYSMLKIKNGSLYLIITEKYGGGKSALKIAKDAIAGGVDIIQMREKEKLRPELVDLGIRLSGLCKKSDVIFIVNDDPLLAKEVGADGVHLGQDDVVKYPVKAARQILGKDKIIGISTSSIEEVERAGAEEINYIGFGPIFSTAIKDNYIGTKDVEKVLAIARKPVFFIGGINMENIDNLLKEGAQNIALIRGILEAEDIRKASREFKEKIKKSVDK